MNLTATGTPATVAYLVITCARVSWAARSRLVMCSNFVKKVSKVLDIMDKELIFGALQCIFFALVCYFIILIFH